MQFGRVMGVNLKVHYLFLLPLLAWGAAGQLLQGLLVFLAVMIHEAGHLITAKSLGYSPREIVLLPFGGVASIEENIGLEPRVEMQIALAGPWTSLLLVGVAVIMRSITPIGSLWDFFLQINIILALFNLLPALPLDGGRVYRAYLVQEYGFKAGTIRAVKVSRFCSLIFLLIGLATVLVSNLSLNFLVMSAFLFFSANHMREQSSYQLLGYLSGKQREIAKLGRMPGVTLIVSTDCRGSDLLELLIPKKYHLFYVVDRAGKLLGVLSEQQVLQAIFEKGLEVPLRHLLD